MAGIIPERGIYSCFRKLGEGGATTEEARTRVTHNVPAEITRLRGKL
jgi:hypothetical protein